MGRWRADLFSYTTEEGRQDLLRYLLAWTTVICGVIALFSYAESVTKLEAKRKVARWLQNLQIEGSLSNWPAQFGAVFDGVFGKRHFSLRCFWRSCVASIISVAVMVTLMKSLSPAGILPGLGSIVYFFVVWNLFPDYLSLLETRYVIKWLSKKDSRIVVLVLLIVDFIITSLIWQVWFISSTVVYMYVVLNILGSEPYYPFWGLYSGLVGTWMENIWYVLYRILFLPIDQRYPHSMFATAMFYSTFFTSVWVWLYVCSGLVVKLINWIGISVGILKGYLDIEKKPILCIGFFACLLITILFLVLAPFV